MYNAAQWYVHIGTFRSVYLCIIYMNIWCGRKNKYFYSHKCVLFRIELRMKLHAGEAKKMKHKMKNSALKNGKEYRQKRQCKQKTEHSQVCHFVMIIKEN